MTKSIHVRRPSEPSELQLLLRLAQNGSGEALGEILEGCRQFLLLVANERLEPELAVKAGASDIVQDTFVSAGRHFSRFKGSTEIELLAWLRQILLNHIGSLRRRFLETQKRRVVREISLSGSSANPFPMDVPAVKQQTPSRHAMQNEQARELQEALNRLPDRCRLVIELRHHQQLPFDQVAQRLELSTLATRQLWARAIKKLQRAV